MLLVTRLGRPDRFRSRRARMTSRPRIRRPPPHGRCPGERWRAVRDRAGGAGHHGLVPVLDLAMTEFRVRDVGGGDTPLIGLPGRIGVFPDQGSHPGPLSFYLLAPVYRLAGSSRGAAGRDDRAQPRGRDRTGAVARPAAGGTPLAAASPRARARGARLRLRRRHPAVEPVPAAAVLAGGAARRVGRARRRPADGDRRRRSGFAVCADPPAVPRPRARHGGDVRRRAGVGGVPAPCRAQRGRPIARHRDGGGRGAVAAPDRRPAVELAGEPPHDRRATSGTHPRIPSAPAPVCGSRCGTSTCSGSCAGRLRR
jgi:hypothetical protein